MYLKFKWTLYTTLRLWRHDNIEFGTLKFKSGRKSVESNVADRIINKYNVVQLLQFLKKYKTRYGFVWNCSNWITLYLFIILSTTLDSTDLEWSQVSSQLHFYGYPNFIPMIRTKPLWSISQRVKRKSIMFC